MRLETLKILSFCLIFLFLSKFIGAQVNEIYFADSTQKDGGNIKCHIKYGNKIIVGGSSFEKTDHFPTVMCVDTMGNVVWNTAISDVSPYGGFYKPSIIKLLDTKDGSIFGFCHYGYGNDTNEVWKINASNGSIVWKKIFLNGSFYYCEHMLDYDASKIMVAYPYNGGTCLMFLSKLTGDTINTRDIGYTGDNYGLTIDNLKNIYYNIEDSVLKLNNTFPYPVIWKKRYTSILVEDKCNMMVFDTTSNQLFCLGYSGVSEIGIIRKVNSSTGAEVSNYSTGIGGVRCRDIKMSNNSLYISWQHLFHPGGNFAFTKYDIISGIADWNNVYTSFTGVGTPSSHSGSGAAASSLDLDANGDLFATGYYGDANYGPENWGILKLNGLNGSVYYEKTITEDSVNYNDLSVGMASCIIHDQPYFIGDLETYHADPFQRTKIAFIKLDKISGNTIVKKYLGGNHQFTSKVVSIENYLFNQTLVTLQNGCSIELIMYDLSKHIVWKKSLSKEFCLFASHTAIAPNGDICLSSGSKSYSLTDPSYSSTNDSIFIFRLNGNGNVMHQYSFAASVGQATPISLFADNAISVCFYRKNISLYYRKADASGLSSEINTSADVSYIFPEANLKCFTDYNSNSLLLFSNQYPNFKVSEIDKTTMALTTSTTIPVTAIFRLNHVEKIATDKVILCGSNSNDDEVVTMFNTNTLDTVWSYVNVGPSYPTRQCIKCVSDPQNQSIYTISNNSYNVVVRRLSALTGNQIWEYTYAGNYSDDFAMDIAYDKFNDRIIVAGYSMLSGVDYQNLILVMDSSGLALDTIVKTGDFPGSSTNTCVRTLSDGTEWVGGNLNKNTYGKAGVIFELTTTSTTIDIVWPGDANSDGVADNLDVLELGLHYTQTGTPRTSTSNSWQSYVSTNWVGTISNGQNLNHSDCNGDGLIDANDTLAIYLNYGLTHAFKSLQQTSTNEQLTILPDEPMVSKGQWGTASVYLGSSANPINTINGLAFTLHFDQSLIEPNSLHIEYPVSFLNTGQNLNFRKQDYANGNLYAATTHTNNSNINGYGKIAVIHYQIKFSLVHDTVLAFSLVQATQSNANGSLVPLTSGSASVTAIGATVGINELSSNTMVAIYPNPANQFLVITSTQELQKVELKSVTGQLIISEPASGNQHQLDVSSVSNGVYVVSVYGKNNSIQRRKIVVQH